MKRYQPTGAVYEHEDLMRESSEGEYVLASEALAELERERKILNDLIDEAQEGWRKSLDEIERLRGLVEAAYHEGFDACCMRGPAPQGRWDRSAIRSALTPPTPTPSP